MRRIANWICLLELALFFLVPLVAWAASVLGADIRNLVSEEAIRWFFTHGSDMLVSPHLALLILFLTAVGALQESQLAHHAALFFRLYVLRQTGLSLPPHSKAFLAAFVLFASCLLMLVVPALMHSSAFLSVSGTLFPSSPWLSGFPIAVCLDAILSSLLYALSASRIAAAADVVRMLTQGFSRYGVWIADVMMGGLLYHIVKYCILPATSL